MPAEGRPGTQVQVLEGPDVTEPGAVAVIAPLPGLAAALSPGRWPKHPPAVDPNEDGVLVAAGGGRVLLAVADAHYGFASARAALDAVHVGAPEVLGAGDVARALSALADRVAVQVGEAVRDQPGSATALSVAVRDGRHVHAITVGDTSVGRLPARGRPRRIGRSTGFAGATTPGVVPQRARLRSGDRLLVASDGLTDYLGSAWLERSDDLVRGVPAEVGVRALVEQAHAAGAGDHVAVALWSPPA